MDPRQPFDPYGHGPGRAPRPEPAFSLAHPRLTLWVLLAVGALVALRLWQTRPPALFDPDVELRPITARGDLAADEVSTVALFEAVSPSVVNIATQRAIERLGLWTRRTALVPEGTGTGFVWDEAGHIVTNYHVLLHADAARVTFGNGESYMARFVGGDPDRDLAVLVVPAPASLLRPLAIGTSGDLRVGQKAFAIGYPFGLDQTLTVGVISGLDRTISTITERPLGGVIQTDAAINPGNSGGPLLDSAGRLIGVNSAIASRSGSSSGVGFAIPVDLVNETVTAQIRGLSVRPPAATPMLGIVADEALAAERGIEGVVVRSVISGSGAAEAGLTGLQVDRRGEYLLGDVVVALDGRPVRDLDDLKEQLSAHAVGDEVRITLERGRASARFQEDVLVVLSG